MVSPSGSASIGSGEAPTRAVETLPAAPDAASAEITIRMTNRSGKPRYIGYGRLWSEQLKIERREGDKWTAISYEAWPCTVLCPGDGTAPVCRFCSPPIPVPEAIELQTRDYTWSGKEFVGVRPQGATCDCYEAVAARPGRYRATLCVMTRIACDPGPCKADQYGLVRKGVRFVEPASCTSAEFDVSGAPRIVALDITR